MDYNYYRSTLIANNPSTTAYWAEDGQGNEKDVLEESIPVGAIVTDLTHDHKPELIKKFIKTADGWVLVNPNQTGESDA